ncbi:Hypothetical protein, putative [Bodo saltans]|uniref:Uncharacterized protein n=1 Tax=Bodo saltans TaxID=75058 RepID=A0A0S4JBC8_BODSA|nr:Hypothetical protein, putative [Bodo saltans]|eukprot:CUG88793.1 Hypothetical protein, putative [Bodo saltans]
MSWAQRGTSEDRVFFQVHGLPQVLKLKIAADSPLHHLFEHIPAQKYQPPLCIDGPEYTWRDIVLDPLKTPEDYDMPSGERNVQAVHVHFPLVSPRTALNAQQSSARGGEDSHQHHHDDTPRNAMTSARLSIDGDRRSPLPNSARAGETATPTMYRASPRNGVQPIPSVDKIIDDLTQALRGAEDEIDELQKPVADKTRLLDSAKPEKVQELEKENARLKTELDAGSMAIAAARFLTLPELERQPPRRCIVLLPAAVLNRSRLLTKLSTTLHKPSVVRKTKSMSCKSALLTRHGFWTLRSQRRCKSLEKENARLKTELDAERRESDSKQEAIQILRNKISALESAASRQEAAIFENSGNAGGVGSQAAEALATSLRHHCHSLEGELANREDDVRQLNAKINSLQIDLDVLRSGAENDARSHKEALERLEATYVVQRKKDEASLDSEESLRLRIDRLERENAILQSDNTTLAQRVVAAESNKTELRGARNQHEIDTAAWGAQKNAFEKEIKALREKNADQLLQSQRHEKVLGERNASLQEKIAFFEDPRSVNQREEEYQQRELEMRSRLRDALAENDRLKTIHKDLKRQVSELETSLFECNNVLVRVQRENTDLKRAGVGYAATSQSVTPRDTGRLPASARTMSAHQNIVGSPLPAVPQAVATSVANSIAQESALLHIDPFSLVRGSPADGRGTSQSPNVADALLLSRHGGNSFRVAGPTGAEDLRSGSRSSQLLSGGTPTAAANLAEFQDA